MRRKYLKKIGLLRSNLQAQINLEQSIHEQVENLFYDEKWEFNEQKLKLGLNNKALNTLKFCDFKSSRFVFLSDSQEKY